MSWFGKIIGGSWGLIFGGPIGAIIGATVGHLLFDRRAGKMARGYGARLSRGGASGSASAAADAGGFTGYNTEQLQIAYFTSVFSIFACIANADGIVTADERRLVEKFAEQNGLTGRKREFALQIFEEALHSSYTITDFARQFASIVGNRRDIHNTFLDMLFHIAAIDGHIHAREIEAIVAVATALGLSQAEVAALQSRYGTNDTNHYVTLGCTPESSDDEIRTAYRRLAAEYHPDKIISHGLPEEFVTFATKRFQDIQEAYQTITRSRNMR